MSKQNKLLIERAIFLLIIFVSFSIIIINEKANIILTPKVDKKIKDYINTNYSEIKQNIIIQDTKYKTNYYETKVISKQNKNYYFYVYYKNKKITDTYKKDYIEGYHLLKHINNDLEKDITNKTKIPCHIKIKHPLNYYTEKVQKRIISEENLLDLKIYSIIANRNTNNWTTEDIIKIIDNLINIYIKNNINPSSYTITITNKKDITEAVEISNIDNNFINNPSKQDIIDAIINKNKENIIKENNIKVKYLN